MVPEGGQQNHVVAQLSLAGCYASGRGVDLDRSEAYAWYSLAARQLPEAAKARDVLELNLSPADLRQSQRRAAELKSRLKGKASEGSH